MTTGRARATLAWLATLGALVWSASGCGADRRAEGVLVAASAPARTLGDPGMLRLDRVFVYVQDMGLQVRFYRDTLGLPVIYPAGEADLSGEYFVQLDAGPCRLVLHGGGEKRFGEDAPALSFHVDDVKAARERLLAKGVKLGEVRSPAPGVLVSDGVDPEGNRFSLDQY